MPMDSTYWLLVFAGIGLRDIVYNCNIRLLRTDRCKAFLSSHQQPQAYNEVFFSFAIQHALAHLAFTVAGIICIARPYTLTPTFVQALFFHHFLWDVSIFVRDASYFSPKFRSFYWIHHGLTIIVGMVWIALGMFEKTGGLGGFLVLTFLGSAFTSSVSFFLRMFQERNSCFYITDMVLSIVQRFWRWAVVTYGLCLAFVIQVPEAEGELPRIMVALVSALGMEAFDAYIHTKNIIFNWRKHKECQNKGRDENGESDGENPTCMEPDNGESDEENPTCVEPDSLSESKQDTVVSLAHGFCHVDGVVELLDDFLQTEENHNTKTIQGMDLERAFEKAIQIVNSKESIDWKLSGIQKLTLYACYKQAKVGALHSEPPSPSSYHEKLKLRARKVCLKVLGDSKEAAMKRYIETVQIFHHEDILSGGLNKQP